ncbi:LysR family transcriptional regulator [Saccharothrix syringae]|uniref:LysR family transcriptional regulator n=1 Tax=Saccharothrix syringae TaxID=103733 RepID=A0A5Q0HF64_SACSY|nr:LysR family transcriptional regulator [Saccharothrix syringae]
METRELAYFVAVAEELHFGRAAERLGLAQPPLSRAIRQLERRLGVVLFERTSRKVELTGAGEELLDGARRALVAVAAAGRRAQRAGRPEPELVLVVKPGGDSGLLGPILDAYAADPDAVPVDVLVCGIGEQAHLLRDGRADVGFLHLPHDDLTGLDHERLLVEPAVAVLPAHHALAGRAEVRMADLAGEPLPRWPGSAADAGGPLVRDSAQLMQLIALGRAVAVLPDSARRHLIGDLVAVPVVDGPLTTVVVAWPEWSRSRPAAAFARVALRVAEGARTPAG